MNASPTDAWTAPPRALLLPLVLTCVLLAAGGCSWMPFVDGGDEARTVQMQIEGQPDMNSGGNAAVVRVYQLAGNSNFENTPLSSFWKDDEAALGDELVSRREVQLFPEASEPVDLELSEATQFVGVAADLREPNREEWRKLYPVSAIADKNVNVTVGTDQLTLDITE